MNRWFSVVSFFVVLLAPLAFAADSGVTGAWKCVGKSGDGGAFEFRLDLKQSGSEVTGTASRSDGQADIRKGSFENGTLKLKIEADDGEYNLEAKLDGHKLAGKLTHTSGLSADWEGVREAAAAAAAKNKGILGDWKGRAEMEDGTIEFVLTLNEDAGTLKGRITLPDGMALPFESVTFADDVLKYTLSTDDGKYESEAKLEGDKLNGTVTMPSGTKRTWEAVRS